MADTPAFQSHHIIEQQALKDSVLLKQLTKDGLFNIDDTHNLLNMPADPELAAKMGVSPHNGGPLQAYSDGLAEQLDKLEKSLDGPLWIRLVARSSISCLPVTAAKHSLMARPLPEPTQPK